MASPVVIPSVSATPRYRGTDLGCTGWIALEQDRIDLFARATGDRRWIHVDPERAARESPWGSSVVDGYLLLSLVPHLLPGLIVLMGWSTAINTGVDRCEFATPVAAGSRVRMRARLARARVLPVGGCRLGFDVRFEVEGAKGSACDARVNYAYFA